MFLWVGSDPVLPAGAPCRGGEESGTCSAAAASPAPRGRQAVDSGIRSLVGTACRSLALLHKAAAVCFISCRLWKGSHPARHQETRQALLLFPHCGCHEKHRSLFFAFSFLTLFLFALKNSKQSGSFFFKNNKKEKFLLFSMIL